MQQNLATRHRVFYQAMPKVELHRHLEGSLRLSTMIEVARDYSLDVPYEDVNRLRSLVQVRDEDPFTHQNFLSKFQTLRKFYKSPEVIQRITQEVIADAAADNIRYMDLRFTPVALTRSNGSPLAEAMDWVIEAAEEAMRKHGVTTRLIPSVNRHESLELAAEVADLAVQKMDQGIIALDLAGNEAEFSGQPFVGIFKEAKQAGLKVTVHAGEWGGPENIIEAIEDLGADRIGHGVRIFEDQYAVDLASELKIPIEVCITSNYQTGVVPTLEAHPLRRMIRAGLNVSLNTDDPSLSQIDLSTEYEVACEKLGLSLEVLNETILNAAQAAFLPQGEKSQLIQCLKKGLDKLDGRSP